MAVDLTKEIYKGTAGIELGGTIYTGAKGDAINKVAYAQLIYDDELKEYQAVINRKMQSVISNTTVIPVYDGYYTTTVDYSDATGALPETLTPDEVKVSLADTSTIIYIKDGTQYTSWTGHDEYSPNLNKTFKVKGDPKLYVNTGNYALVETTDYFSKTFALGTISAGKTQGTGNAVTGFGESNGITYPLYGKTFAEKSEVDAVTKKVSDMLNGAPAAYDTLKEIADKLEANDELHDAINASVNALNGLKVHYVTPTSNNSALFDSLDPSENNWKKTVILYTKDNGYSDGINDTLLFTIERTDGATLIITNSVMNNDKDFIYLTIGVSSTTETKVLLENKNIKDNTINNSKLVDKTITNAKIANSTIISASIGPNAVITEKIMDGNVTEAKLSAEVQTKLNSVIEWEEL